jgi:hypothetical protein
MIAESLDAITSWRTVLVALLVFGFAPGALLRLIALAFRRDDPRRSELLAELRVVPRVERPFWVVEQLELAVFEGVWNRVRPSLKDLQRTAILQSMVGLLIVGVTVVALQQAMLAHQQAAATRDLARLALANELARQAQASELLSDRVLRAADLRRQQP